MFFLECCNVIFYLLCFPLRGGYVKYNQGLKEVLLINGFSPAELAMWSHMLHTDVSSSTPFAYSFSILCCMY